MKRSAWVLILCLAGSWPGRTEEAMTKSMDNFRGVFEKLTYRFNYQPDEPVLIVDISDQILLHCVNGELIETFPVSTSKYGVGNRHYSHKTPLGTHKIEGKIGAGAPKGTIFRGRMDTKEIAKIHTDQTDTEDDFITSRILRLRGLEEGVNSGEGVDTFDRYIYIHGTPEEGLIGSRASHGCVRMKNDDIIRLFEEIPENALVEIVE